MIIPFTSDNNPYGDDITLRDIKELSLDEKVMDISIPIFLVFLKTRKGDFLGTLRFFDTYVHFRPVSYDLMGLFDFSG